MGSNPELLRQSTHSLLHKNPKGGQDNMGDESCTADMLVLKRATKHCNESNDNLISDEININLSREISSNNHHPSHTKLLNLSGNKPARNNNYFDVDDHSRASKDQHVNKAVKKSLAIESDEEEEGIVGGVDDAEEFKLGKIN